MRRLLLASLLLVLCVPAARAEFPWAGAGDPGDPTSWRQAPTQRPADVRDKLEWMYASTPEAGNPQNADPNELGGVRGAHVADVTPSVDTAWEITTGRPDVIIAVTDSGIKWDDVGAMRNLANKTALNAGELPTPRHDRSEALVGGVDCARYADADDANGDKAFNIVDFACDGRVERDPAKRSIKGVGPAEMLDPQDVLIAFTDGKDDDGNGFNDDMVGWDFLDDDNDPYDDVQYGHGTGESIDSNAEVKTPDVAGKADKEAGTCPNCMVWHMRVGDSFIADVNNFAQAVIYAADNGASVVQDALGTLNNSSLAREAMLYAYRHGTTIIASWADEAAEHHNQPAALPHAIVVNSMTMYDDTFTPVPRSYLQFTGCTNFGSKVTLSIPSVSCSSDATGRASGMAGLIYSAALNGRAKGTLGEHGECRRANGSPCAITPNEVRQLMATGTVAGTSQADDVSFTVGPEQSCTANRSPQCTDPNLNSVGNQLAVSPLATTKRYPARKGPDLFYGYGRVNMFKAADAASKSRIPPEAELFGPEWYEKVDPARAQVPVTGEVAAVRADDGGRYTCEVHVAPGAQPNNATTDAATAGDFKKIGGGWCDGSARTGFHRGTLATIDTADLKARFPSSAGDFRGREPGTVGQTANGRPNSEPFAFTYRVVVRAKAGGVEMTGEDRRQSFLHRDKDLLAKFPIGLGGDGASPPLFADLDGDNRNELVLGTGDGLVHAYRPDGSELPGWPVESDDPLLHTGTRAFTSGEVRKRGASILASVTVGDLDADGDPEVVGADLHGRMYAWSAAGKRLWRAEAEVKFSGRPLEPFKDVRRGKTNRTQHAWLGSPTLVDLDGNGTLEVVAANMDRHVYAFDARGKAVKDYPTLVVDRSKVEAIDPTTHRITFKKDSGSEQQGAIVDTPAVGDITGDGKPEIVIGTNEEYLAEKDGGMNASSFNAASVSALGQTGQLSFGNTRLYALKAGGGDNPVVSGWPVKLGMVFTELLPVVGEGVTGSPVIGVADCMSGGSGPKVGAVPNAGLAYVFNPDGKSCLGQDGGKDRTYATDAPGGPQARDLPVFAAVGQPIFGNFGGGTSLITPVAGVMRALDLAANEYQGGQDYVGAWDTRSGQFRTGFPSTVNDLQFIAGPAVADLDGNPGEEIIAATASLDIAAMNANGQPMSADWPKLSGDWNVATPTVGSFGTRDSDADARKVVAIVTRIGELQVYKLGAPACSPGSWARFHHDNANSGDARRDATPPGVPEEARLEGNRVSFKAPGDDGLCGQAKRYEVTAADGRAIPGADAPGRVGAAQHVDLPDGVGTRVRVRAVDEQGNHGRAAVVAIPKGSALAGSSRRSGRCLRPPLRVSSTRVGPVRIGMRTSSLIRSLRPRLGKGGSLHVCVKSAGRVLVGSSKGKVIVIATTARISGVKGVQKGMAARKLTGARKIKGIRGGLRRGKLVLGVRRGKVHFVAVATKQIRSDRKRLRRALRPLGFDQ